MERSVFKRIIQKNKPNLKENLSGILGNLTSPLSEQILFHVRNTPDKWMWKERVIWALLTDPSQPLLSNAFSLSTLPIETMIRILPMRDLEKAPHQGLTPPPATPPSSQKYVPAYYSDTIRAVWGKLESPLCLIVTWSKGIVAVCNKTFHDKFFVFLCIDKYYFIF